MRELSGTPTARAETTELPLRSSEAIQGEILAGFSTRHQCLLFVRFHDVLGAREWLRELTPRVATTRQVVTFAGHLPDACAPGNGDVDWSYIAAGLPATALRVFEIDQHQPDDKVAAGIDYLRARNVI